jgi:hypothetical protein
MKKQSMNFIASMSETSLQNLVKIVDETLALTQYCKEENLYCCRFVEYSKSKKECKKKVGLLKQGSLNKKLKRSACWKAVDLRQLRFNDSLRYIQESCMFRFAFGHSDSTLFR